MAGVSGFGCAKGLSVKLFNGASEGILEKKMNDWLRENGLVDVLDVQFRPSATYGNKIMSALVVYRE